MNERPRRGAMSRGVRTADLELIRAVCDAGGFSGAARMLGLSQPSLSRSVGRLERRLGAPLFDRDVAGATPTAFGRFLATRADDVLSALGSIEQDVARWTSGEAGVLRIGVGAVTRVHPLPVLVDHLARHHPDIRTEIRHDVGPVIAEGVAKGRFDLALSYSGNADDFGDLLRVRLFAMPRVCAVRTGHPLAQAAAVSARDLLAFALASPGVTPAMRLWLHPGSAEERQRAEHFVCDDVDMICLHASLTDSVAIGPELIFAADVARGLLVQLPLVGAPDYECWMLTSRRALATPLMQSISGALRSR